MEVLYIFILSEPFVGIYNRKKKNGKMINKKQSIINTTQFIT